MHQNSPDARPRSFLFGGGSSSELLRIGSILHKEAVSGALLVVAAIIALIWANSPLSAGYFQLRDTRIGYAPWHLELSLGEWASDGLLAIFFFLVGLELKREFLIGDLREPSKSVVPVAAAAGGVAVPALIYTMVNLASPETLRGWAIPTATDIAFAVAVLALIGSHLPGALRIFLLTLAVVDDLIAIGIIAFFYSHDIRPEPLLLLLLALCSYTLLAHRYRRFFNTPASTWLILLPLGTSAWVLVHNSGIHATVAGVLLGFAVPLVDSNSGPQPGGGLAEILEHRLRPVSAGIAVPVFAFFAAGVQVGDRAGIGSLLSNSVTLGIIIALVVGKPVGILGTVWLLTRTTRARLDRFVTWIDIFGVSLLGGIGFTVSMLISASATAAIMLTRRRQGSWRRPSSPRCWPPRSWCPGTGAIDDPARPGLPAQPAQAAKTLRSHRMIRGPRLGERVIRTRLREHGSIQKTLLGWAHVRIHGHPQPTHPGPGFRDFSAGQQLPRVDQVVALGSAGPQARAFVLRQ